MAVWHLDAKRVPYSDAGPLIMSAPARIVWHTTEGVSLPVYSGSAPHFTLNPKTGELWQHIPINRCAKSLVNAPGGVETNRQHAVQVELIGSAKDTQDWPRAWYSEIADLARWIEKNAGVSRRCGVKFVGGGHTNHMTAAEWTNYRGHCGHQHVPENLHWDPGLFRIDWVLEVDDDPRRAFVGGEVGPDVSAFQRAINKVARNNCRPDHMVSTDGVVGPLTLKHGAWAVWMRGAYLTQAGVLKQGIGTGEQLWARDWDAVKPYQRARAKLRRARHNHCKGKS